MHWSATLLLCASSWLAAQDKPASPSNESEQIKLARAQTALFRFQYAESGAEIERLANPVLQYTDPARGDVEGTLWLWGKQGRPVAVLELFRVRGVEAYDFWYGFHATTNLSIKMIASTGQSWTPQSSALKFQPLPGATPPAALPAGRMAQMRDFARKFSAHEFWMKGRHELRLLAAPVHRYDDRDGGLIDGALFVIAHGTHPEATLFLEAVQPADEVKPVWQFGIGRSGAAEIVVLYDDKEVHRVPPIASFPPPTSNYWRMTSKLDDKGSK
jgi:hypothetical protein